MRLLTHLRIYYGLSATEALFTPWPQIQDFASFIPEWEYRRNVQTAYLALMWAGKNTRLRDVLSPYAEIPKRKPHDRDIVRDLQLAMHLGVISQLALDSFDTTLVDQALGR